MLSQEMFMLFFSILYGIMLNSLIGLGAFPVAAAFAFKDVENRVCGKPIWRKGYRSFRRLVLSIILLNFFPFIWFAFIFHNIEDFIGNLSLTHLPHTIFQILSIGLLSLSVFAFYRFFLGLIVWQPCGNSLFYTPYELEEHIKDRAIYPSSWRHILAGILYLIIPWLVVALFIAINVLPK